MLSNIEESENISLAWYLIAAMLFHAVLWRSVQFVVPSLKLPSFLAANRTPAPIEIENLDELTKRQVVKTDAVEFDKKLLNKKARFAGEIDNRVEKESVSPTTGKFLPGGIALRRGQSAAQAQPEAKAKEMVGTPNGDIPQSDLSQWRRSDEIGMSDLMAYGASPYKLPSDVAEGANTVLNTDGVTYASYINRIADEIYGPWVENAQSASRQLMDQKRNLDESTYVTKLGVTLSETGSVLGIQTIKSSGIELFDEASKKAFWAAEPFPNPPAQLFSKERRIHLVYEFHFEWKSSFFSVFPRRI